MDVCFRRQMEFKIWENNVKPFNYINKDFIFVQRCDYIL